MAISQGVGPHQAWLTVNGQTFPVQEGTATQTAKRKSASFAGSIPMSYPGARGALAYLGDNEASITVLTRGQVSPLVTGELDTVKLDYIGRKIHFTGRDKSAKIHSTKTSEKWLNRKPSDIVQDLIGRLGLSGNITPSAVMAGKQLQQDYVKLSDNVSYGYIIGKLAELDGVRWFVDPTGTFHYVPIGSPIGVYSITVNQDAEPISSDCIRLSIQRNIHAGKSVNVSVKSWHPKKKDVFQYQSTVPGTGGPINYNFHIPGLLQPDVAKYARSEAMEKILHELTVDAQIVGDPAVFAGMGLSVSGTDYDQTYDIDTVHHEYGMCGHKTHIVARAPKQGRTAS